MVSAAPVVTGWPCRGRDRSVRSAPNHKRKKSKSRPAGVNGHQGALLQSIAGNGQSIRHHRANRFRTYVVSPNLNDAGFFSMRGCQDCAEIEIVGQHHTVVRARKCHDLDIRSVTRSDR